MATDTPKGWGWNPSVLTLCLIVAGLIAGGAYYIGHMAAQVEFLERQAQHTEAVAQDAQKVATFTNATSDKGDGHKPANSNTAKPKTGE